MRPWFYARQGKTYGPFSPKELRALAKEGRLLPDDLVSHGGASKWVPARSVPDLFGDNPAVTLVQPAAERPAVAGLPEPAPLVAVPAANRTVSISPAEDADVDKPGRSYTQTLVALPKPILFGLCGAVGGLLGALLIGELLWALLSPAGVRDQGPRLLMAVPDSMRVYTGGKNRFLVKIARERFKGPISLEADKAPTGVVVPPVTIPANKDEAEVEVQVSKDFPPGNYRLWINGHSTSAFTDRDSATPNTPADTGTVTLSVEPPPSSLRLSVSPKVALFKGGKSRFTVKLAWPDLADRVELGFAGVPPGVIIPGMVVENHQSEVQVNVSAPPTQPVGSWTVTVQAVASPRGQKLTGVADFNLQVIAPPLPQADILFVLDLTGSMQFAIDGVKQGIQSFVSQLENKNIDARIGLIGFRDIVADFERPFALKFDGQPFTKDYQSFREQVKQLKANGGGDEPESSLQALALAAQQPFRANAAKVLLLITDAPPKIHPNETPSTIDETIAHMKGKVSQLHLVVHQRHYGPIYKQFHDTFKGSFFDLGNATNRTAFEGILPKLGDEISLITVASQPAAPSGSSAPPPLPVESGARLPPPVQVPVLKAVQSTQTYTEDDAFRLLVAIAVWTMVIAGAISLLILAGQRLYASQSGVGLVEAGRALAGGILAGVVGGTVGQLFFQSTAGGAAMEVVSRILGWSLLGGLIGGGMSFFVPNLKWTRGLIGGVIGGFLGALAFLAVSPIVGSLLGRWIGAAILGFFIGLMVALAELAFRRWWLEIAFGPREMRTITLGTAPVSIGGDERRASICVQGSPPITLRYRIDGTRVLCEDVVKERTEEVQVGDRRTLGKVSVTVCSAAEARKIGYTLELSNGRSYLLGAGLPLTAEDLPGLQPQGADGVVALVSSRPNDPKTLLLRNRSQQTWAIWADHGSQQTIDPGRGVELGSDVQISFGQLQGTLKRDPAGSS